MDYITLGKIIGTCGLHGEIKVFSTTEFGNIRYQRNNSIQVFDEKKQKRTFYMVRSYKNNGRIDHILFNEINSIEEAEKLVGCYIQIEKQQCVLPNGFYHYDDLKRCRVFDEKGNLIGNVIAVEEYVAQKTLRIKRNNEPDILVPFVAAFIKHVSINEKMITIHVIEGLL